jgi:hypothetical protein
LLERVLVEFSDLEVRFEAERPQRLFEGVHGVFDFVLGCGAAVAGLASAHEALPDDR